MTPPSALRRHRSPGPHPRRPVAPALAHEPVTPTRYACGLYRYGAASLERDPLRAWMTCRLIEDLRLGHDRAAALVDETLGHASVR